MDLNKYAQAAVQTAFLHLDGPDGEPLYAIEDDPKSGKAGIDLISADSKEYQKLQHKHQDKRLDKVRIRGGKVRNNITAAGAEADATELMASCFVKIHHFELEGNPLESSFENALLLLDQPWIREQVDEFVHDRSNYLGE